jgi:aromatic-L-amino-acid decarboxylase
MSPLDIAITEGRRFIDSQSTRSVAPTGSRADILAPMPTALPATGMDPADVVRLIARAAEPGLMGNLGGRFFAWVKGGALPAAHATDVLATLWDQNVVLAATSPAGAVLEEVAGRLLLDALHLPADCAYSFTTGCQMSHTTALAAARHHVLARAGWDVEHDGLFGAPPICVLANAHRHSSVDRALRLLGIGTAAIVPLGGGGPGKVGAAELQAALAATLGAPTIVVLNAGDLNLGACDEFATLAPMAQVPVTRPDDLEFFSMPQYPALSVEVEKATRAEVGEIVGRASAEAVVAAEGGGGPTAVWVEKAVASALVGRAAAD